MWIKSSQSNLELEPTKGHADIVPMIGGGKCHSPHPDRSPRRKLSSDQICLAESDVDGAPNAYNPENTELDDLKNAGEPGCWEGLAKNRDGNPFIRGPNVAYPGYYVSATALADRTRPFNDPSRYVDASKIPYVVLPGNLAPELGARPKDFAAVFNLQNGRSSPAIFADDGPVDHIGEGSVALAENLGIRSDSRSGGTRRGILYLVFPGPGNDRPRRIEEIHVEAEKLFKARGGIPRPPTPPTKFEADASTMRARRGAPKRQKLFDSEISMNDKLLREHLKNLLAMQGAHLDWKAAFNGIPPRLRGVRPKGMPHSAWELFEHMRIAQWDILEFSHDAKHVSPEWPAGYWPKTQAPPAAKAWDRSLKAFAADLEKMKKLILNPKTDVFARIPHGTGQTILREALLVADHNSYHLGQVIYLRRLLGVWKKD